MTQKKIEYLLQEPTLAEALQHDTATRTAQFLELPVEKIDKLCIAEFERRRELVERWRFYNQPHASADFKLFGKVGHWTAPETVALLLGKNSDFVNWHYLKEFQDHDEQAFTDFQSLRIENLDLTHYLTKRYLELCVMLSRAEVFIPKTRDVDPVSALSWARGNDISIPAQLEAVFAGKNARTVTWMIPAAEPSDSTPVGRSNVAPEPQAVPLVPVVPESTSETKKQREDRRLQACIDAGLPMNAKATLSRLPDGVGVVAGREGVTRQALSTDVKAALKRRESAQRDGGTIHRS